jgi:hypothetical protein
MQPTTQERRQALTPPSSPEEHDLLRGEWMNFFARPEVQAGLLQFGIGMLQPIGWGQSQTGNVGLALGDAAGAVGRVNEQRLADRDFAQKQANEETEQDLENRRVGAVEQEGARRAADDAANRALEERKLEEYLIPSLTSRGRGGGGVSPDSTRNAMMKSLMTQALKAQADAAAVGDEFDMDAYIDAGMAAMNRMLGTTAPEGGPTAATPTANLPDISTVSDEDIIDLYANGTAEEQAAAEAYYGEALLVRKGQLVKGDLSKKEDEARSFRDEKAAATSKAKTIEEKRQAPLENFLFQGQ